MMKLKDLGYSRSHEYGTNHDFYVFSKLDTETGNYKQIWIREDGLYSSFYMITPEEHEAITGELFEMGIYKMIGKHLRKHD